MKKTIYLVRHAKAEDRTPFMRDHDRELVSEGIIASARVGRHLAARDIRPDCLISSTAARARDTAKVTAEQLKISADTIELDPHLYDGGPKAYLAAVNRQSDDCSSVMLFGHNPDISYFAEYLSGGNVGSMKKSAVAIIEVDNHSWAEISGRLGRLAEYISPKDLHEHES